MTQSGVTRVVAVLSSGLMAGLLFGDWLGPSFARSAMGTTSFIEFQQIVHINYLLVLPALSTIAAGAPVPWLVVLRRERGTLEFTTVLCAAVAIVIGYTITLVVNVPVNDQLESWTLAGPPADAREIWRRWEIAHVVRTVFWVAGFFLELIALAARAPRILSAVQATAGMTEEPAG
jgi:uncharacterized membrane protein